MKLTILSVHLKILDIQVSHKGIYYITIMSQIIATIKTTLKGNQTMIHIIQKINVFLIKDKAFYQFLNT